MKKFALTLDSRAPELKLLKHILHESLYLEVKAVSTPDSDTI